MGIKSSEEIKNIMVGSKKRSKADEIYDKILAMIIEDESLQNSVITERMLTDTFKIGRAPVREALVKLCSEGLLTSIPRYGYVINHLSPQEEHIVMKVRILLEQEALRSSFEDIYANHLGELEQKLDYMMDTKEVWEICDDNNQFHMQLASYADNPMLLEFLQLCLNVCKRIYAQEVWNSQKGFDAHIDKEPHRKIFEAIRDHDLELALELLRRDIINGSGGC